MAPDGLSDPRASDRLAPEVVSLFHRLNNQLGVILANSELLETKLTEESHRVRAAQVVTGALEAIGIVQHLKQAVGTAPADPIRHGR